MSEILLILVGWNLIGLVISTIIALTINDENGLRFLASMLIYPVGLLACIICVAQYALRR